MRRLALLLAVVLLCAPRVKAAIAVVQPTAGLPLTATVCSAATSCAYAMPSQPTAGNALIVSHSFSGGTTSLVPTDTGSNTYSSTTCKRSDNGACDGGLPSNSSIQIFYTTNLTTAGSFNVTARTNASSGHAVFVAEYSGVQNASPVDKQAQAAGTSTTPAVASQTATNANSLYVAAIVHDGSGTVSIAGGGSFTERSEQENTANFTQGYEDIISSGAQTGPFTLGVSSAWADTMVIFIPATGAAAPPTRTLLGVGRAR